MTRRDDGPGSRGRTRRSGTVAVQRPTVGARASRVAAVATIVGFPLATLGAAVLAWSVGGQVWTEFAQAIAMAIPFGGFGLVGALVLARRPGNLVGPICAGIAALFASTAVAIAYAGWGLSSPVPRSGTVLAIWIGNWTWYPLLGAAMVALPLVIPDGRLVSPRWHWVGWLGSVSIGGMVLLAMLHPELSTFAGEATVANPIGIHGVPSPIGSTTASLLLLPLGLAALAALASVGVRYRRAGAEDRTRLKWIVFTFATMFVVTGVLDLVQQFLLGHGGRGISNTAWAAAWTLLPAGIGIAVLRHRLFDIDRVVSRTVSYAMVTVVLAGVYAVGVVAFGGLLRALTGGTGGDLVVAASTLLAVAAFGPVRHRAQAAVDRRFSRARYDAQRTVEAFGHRLRDEVDLDRLAAEIREVTVEAVRPAHASLWLRSVGSSP